MATGLPKNTSVVGLEEEVTEGVYVAPSAATSFVQPLEDGFNITPGRELIDRAILNNSIGRTTPRLGVKSAAAELPVEFRGSGVEGGEPDFHSALVSALGADRGGSASTTKAAPAHTSTVLQIEDADIGKYSVGDIVVVREAGAYEARPISAIVTTLGSATITFPFALDNGAPAASVVIAAFKTYVTANDGHPSLSVSYYWADEINQAAVGSKVTSMAVDNFATGQVPSLNFSLEGLTYRDEANESAPFTPNYDDVLPPIILSTCLYRNGIIIPVNTLTLSLANTLGFLTDMCSPNGRVKSRVTKREISGSINPHKDDALTNYFDDWAAGTEFSLFVTAANPSSTPGELDLGSIVSIWLPQVLTTEFQTTDLEGILVDELSFQATRGASGDQEEMYISMT